MDRPDDIPQWAWDAAENDVFRIIVSRAITAAVEKERLDCLFAAAMEAAVCMSNDDTEGEAAAKRIANAIRNRGVTK